MKPWSQDEYQEILNLPTHIVAMISRETTFYKVNQETSAILGWAPDEVFEKKVSDFIHPDDWEETHVALKKLFLDSTSIITYFTNRCLHEDQTYRWISWSAKATGDYIYCMGTDVTQKRQFEQELSIQALVLESISEGVVICDERGNIVYINAAEEVLFGYEQKELLGKPMELINGRTSDESQEKVKSVFSDIKKNGIWIGEWENRKKNGTIFTTSCRVTNMILNGERHLVIVQRDVTDRKKQLQEKDALQNRFSTFFEQSVLPMEIYDLEGNPLAVNQAWEDLFQTTKDHLKGYNIVTDPTSVETGMLPFIKRAYAGEAGEMEPFYLDPAKIGKPGRPRWLEAWFSPVKDENNKVKEMAMILKDVTKSKETENQLKQTENSFKIISERLSMAVKIGKVGVWEWHTGEDKVYWDETLEGIYGYAPGTFPGDIETYSRAFYPDDKEDTWKAIKDSQIEKKAYLVEHRIIRTDGQVRWIQGAGTTVYDENDQPSLMMGTAIDITERKVAALDQKFLAEISEMLSSSFDILENLKRLGEHGINYFCDGCIVDQLYPDGEIRRTLVATNSGEKRKTLQSFQDKYPYRYTHEHPLFTALITGKTTFHSDVREILPELQKKYGKEYFEEMRTLDIKGCIVVRLKGKESLLGTITFFSNRDSKHQFNERSQWLAEEIAFRTSMALENSLLYINSQEAIKSRDEFMSIASHELKTPLTSLTLQNQMRRRQLDNGDRSLFEEAKVRKMVDLDDRQLKRINRLIDDMLDISRIRAERLVVNKEDFEFCQFIKDVVENFMPQMDASGCTLSVHLPEPIIMNADMYRLEQVVINLLTNAMKYGAGKPVRVEVIKTNYKISLLVHDEGMGIDLKDIDRIFQRFERAVSGREISGLGLGLYISRQIVELHDGTLFVTSRVGEGSTFIMDLPL
jgi:PAS domain S-box-containing protein